MNIHCIILLDWYKKYHNFTKHILTWQHKKLMKKILITRSITKSKKLGEYLIKNNHEIFCERLFKVKKIIPDTSLIDQKINLIITSSNALHVLKSQKIHYDSKIFCVGSITAQRIIQMGYKNVFFPKKNSAIELYRMICKTLSPQTIYYFHGEKIAYNFKIKLCQKNFEVRDFLSYKTAEIIKFSNKFLNFINDNVFDEVLIFSNNSLEIFYKQCLKNNLVDYFNLSTIICISQKVAKNAKNLGFKNIKIFNK